MRNLYVSRKHLIMSGLLTGAGVVILLSIRQLWPLAAGHMLSSAARNAFAEESAALEGAISSVVGYDKVETVSQCGAMRITTFRTTMLCEYFYIHAYSFDEIAPNTKNALSENAKILDALLLERGWKPDRPTDEIHTVADSNPYNPNNGGYGGGVPFHKNISDVSCNLQIDFDSLHDSTDHGAINVNQFGCSQTVSFFSPNFYNWEYVGP